MEYLPEIGAEIMASYAGPVILWIGVILVLIIAAAIGLLILMRIVDGCQSFDKWFYRNILGWKDEDVDHI